MPENTPLYDEMTVRGFLAFLAELRGYAGRERDRRVDGILDKCMLTSVRNQTIDTLKTLGVERVYPAHCTSLSVKAAFANAFDTVEVGVGLTINWEK